jgi:cardiolipin synthase
MSPSPGRRAVLGLPLSLSACASFPSLPEHGIATTLLHRAALASAPELEGNAATLLAGGASAVRAQLAAINAARDSIHMEFYMLEDIPGPSGETLFVLLARKVAQGVAVAVTYDGIGSSSTSRAAFEGLRAAGVRLVSFNPVNPLRAHAPWRPNHRTHRKILVVDGRTGFTGGVNFDHVYANPCGPGAVDPEQDADAACWDDIALRLRGPAVAQLQRLFLASWARQGGAPLPQRDWFPPPGRPGQVRARILGSSPGDGQPFFHAVRLAALEGARRRAWFATGYLVPTPRELAELAAAARRGVDVRILLPRAGDHPIATHAQRAIYTPLLEAGVRILETTDRVMHAKVALVDDAWCSVGSSNFDRRAAAWNDEVDAILPDPAMTAALARLLDGRMARATTVDSAAWRNRPLRQRLREALARPFSDQL